MTQAIVEPTAQVDEDEMTALLALRRLPAVGDVACVALLRRFGSARRALGATLADRGVDAVEDLAWARGQLARARDLGAWLLAYHDHRYPALLRHIHDPPPYLFVRGRVELLQEAGVAIVGSRRSSPYGRGVAHGFGRDLAGRGLVVTSGMARGIDAAAHEGALAAGATIAVLGCGADVAYPKSNLRLYQRILSDGAIVSELPLGTRPAPGSFPRRNRIISGLSLGVVVAEAPERSGALITARCAAEQGREVFAIPGEITNRRCHGCLNLLRDGACLARSAGDVVEELWTQMPHHVQIGGTAPGPETEEPEGLDDDAGRLLALLTTGVRHVDSLTRDSGLASAKVLSTLLQLELIGVVESLPGGVYARRRR